MRVIGWILDIAFLIYMWGVIEGVIHNWFVSSLLAIAAAFVFWFVVAFVLGLIVVGLDGDERYRYKYPVTYIRSSSSKRAEASPVPMPTEASQQTWTERMRGPRMTPPE